MSLSARLEAHSTPEPNTGCVLWFGGGAPNGYGHIGIKKKTRLAHRVSYELARGPIPHGLQLDHLCRVRCCINPDHLEPVTPRENVRRGDMLKVMRARKGWYGVGRRVAHCKHGHDYAVHGVARPNGGKRYCAECNRIRARNNYQPKGRC
jgi:hypothetical protein